jgi:hypothetical protein
MSFGNEAPENVVRMIRGPVADPGPDILSLLGKDVIARIKYRQLEMGRVQLQAQLDVIQMTMDALKKEYKIG